MRKTTFDDYRERLDRVIEHIYKHLDDDLDLMRLADIACLSHYHWHRVYVAMRGETVATTVRRLRLFRAAGQLANTEMTIESIAKRAHYSTVSAFNRAFKDAIGQPPAEFRKSGSHARYREAIREQSKDAFEVDIVEAGGFRCASVSHIGPYIHIDQAMHRALDAVLAHNPAHVVRMIGVFLDDPDSKAEKNLRSKACLPVARDFRIVSPLEEHVIPAGPCARLRYTGPYADMKIAYRWLFGVWLPHSGYEASDNPVFEEYLNNPQEVAPADLRTDIHLPLKATDTIGGHHHA